MSVDGKSRDRETFPDKLLFYLKAMPFLAGQNAVVMQLEPILAFIKTQVFLANHNRIHFILTRCFSRGR